MNHFRNTISVSLLLGLASCCGAAHAQTTSDVITAKLAGNAVCSPSDTFKNFTTTLSVYPYAHFDLGAGKGSADGGMFTLDTTYTFPKREIIKSIDFGGWYWLANAGNSLYEVHTTAMVTDRIGVRGGWLTTSDQHAIAWDGFALYNIKSSQFAGTKNTKRPWTVQLGPGFLIDPSGGHNSTGFSAMVNGSLEIGRNFSFNANYWYINDQATANNRVMVGIAKKL